MIPNRRTEGLSQRLSRMACGSCGPADVAELDEHHWPWFLASSERQPSGNAGALADSFLTRIQRLEAAERLEWVDPLLSFCLTPRAALLARRSALPREVLARLIDNCVAFEIVDALAARMRTVEILAYPTEIAALVAGFRAKPPARSGKIAGEMQKSQRLEEMFRTLTSPAAEEVLVEMLSAATHLELSRRHLRVVVAAIFPVLDAPAAASGNRRSAILAIEAWQKWLTEMRQLRESWLHEEQNKASRPPAPAGAPDTLAERHALRLSELLTAVVKADAQGEEPPPLPEAVHVGKALDEVGSGLLDFCLENWRASDDLTVRILNLLPALHISRSKLAPLTEQLLWARPEPSEPVQLATVVLLGHLLPGLSKIEAASAGPHIVHKAGDDRYALLDQNTRAIVEAGERIRHRLTEWLDDRKRSSRVREEALLVLLGTVLPPEEEERLLVKVAESNDEALLAGFLRFVGTRPFQKAYPHLERLHHSASQLSPRLQELLGGALAAAGHEQTPQLLRPDILQQRTAAEIILRQMGASGALDQILSERSILANLKTIAKLDQTRSDALKHEASAFERAMAASADAQSATIKASRWSMTGHTRSAELLAQNAEVQLEILPQIDHLQALLAQVRVHRERLDKLLRSVTKLRSEMQEIESTIRYLIGQIESAERQIEQSERSLARLRSQQSELSSQISSLKSRLANEQSDLASLQSQLSRVGYGEEDASERRRLERKCASATAAIESTRRDIARRNSEFQAIPRQIDDLTQTITNLRSEARSLEHQVQSTRAQLAEKNSRQQDLRGQVATSERDLDELRRRVAALRAKIREIGDRGDSEASRRKQELDHVHSEVRSQLDLLARAHESARRELSESQKQRNRASEAATSILGTEQGNSQLQGSIESKKPLVATELATLSARVKKMELSEQQRIRLLQELEVNIDVLMSYLRIMMGPTPEAKRLFDKWKR